MKNKFINSSFLMVLCFGLVSCGGNSEFFNKKVLEDKKDKTNAETIGGKAGGGATGATDGGASGSTIGGASGSTIGGATGSTIGGASGSTIGGASGSTIGGASGSTIGGATGSTIGGASGSTIGGATGSTIGGASGSTIGGATGSTIGGASGSTIGGATGSTIGGTTGATAGGATGSTIGGTTGATAGGATGSTIGGTTGATAGGATGSTIGGTTGATAGGATGGTSGATAGGSTGGSSSTEVIEVFKQVDENKKIDIVWIVDNSGSMTDEQSSLGSNFSAFIDSFIMKDVDFKMAITTTDTSSEYRKGLMIKHSDKKLTSSKARKDPDEFKSDFRRMIKVGTYGSGREKGLEASEGFMSKYAKSFLRSDAYLAVVLVSDEEDQSSKEVQKYTDYLKTFKSTGGLVKFYSVVDVHNTNCCGGGIITGSDRYKLASKQTAGLIANIRDNFHSVLSAMGDSIIKLLSSFALANKPIEGSLKVYVNGALSSDYTYDAATHSIKFNENFLPPEGSEIKVVYRK